MNLIKRLFSKKPSGSAGIFDAIQSMQANVEKLSIGAANAAKESGDVLKSLLSRHPKQFRKMLEDEQIAAHNIVFAMTANNCEQKLSSGELHVYRGVLSDRGKGYRASIQHRTDPAGPLRSSR
jgi:transposase-like protein